MAEVIDLLVVLKVSGDLRNYEGELPEWLCSLVDRAILQGGRLTDGQWRTLKRMWYKYHPGCMPPWTTQTGV